MTYDPKLDSDARISNPLATAEAPESPKTLTASGQDYSRAEDEAPSPPEYFKRIQHMNIICLCLRLFSWA
eukprot:g70655.t1